MHKSIQPALGLLGLLFVTHSVIGQESPDDPPAPQESDDADRTVRRLGDVVSESGGDFSMDIPTLAQPAMDRPDVSLPDPDRNRRLQSLLDRLVAQGTTPELEAELASLMAAVRRAGLDALDGGDLDAARLRQVALLELAPSLSMQAEIRVAEQRADAVRARTQRLESALAASRLAGPGDDSALVHLAALRELAPGDAATTAAAEDVAAALSNRFAQLLAAEDFSAAGALLDAVEASSAPDLAEAGWRAELQNASRARVEALRSRAETALAAADAAAAAAALEDLESLASDDAATSRLRARLDRVRRYGRFEPGDSFRDSLGDGGRGPEMIVIPAGRARLGSPEGEPGRFSDEGPTYEVTIERGYALSRTEITVEQFRTFVRATGYRTDAERDGGSNIFSEQAGGIAEQRNVTWQQDYLGAPAADDLPVVHVSWNDARAFADWLAERTGQPYRLPSEAEFEYALRGGTSQRFWWGDGVPSDTVENLAGARDRLGPDQRWNDAFAAYRDGFWGPAPAASFEPNPYGLYDIGGNVLEWTEDCWQDNFREPPRRGEPRTGDGCERRVLRGGAWSNGPASSRSAYRLSGPADFRDARVGFRLARDVGAAVP